MSLHPDSAYCWRCNGVIPLGAFGRRLDSRCKCDEQEAEAWLADCAREEAEQASRLNKGLAPRDLAA